MPFFTCLMVEEVIAQPFVQIYWAAGDHLGEAIERMVAAARANGLTNPISSEAGFADRNALPDRAESDHEQQAFWMPGRFYFPYEPRFHLPEGIILSCREGPRRAEEIRTGFSMENLEDGMYEIVVNVEKDALLPTYAALLRLSDSYRVFWYRIHDHWVEGAPDAFLINEELDTPDRILRHLQENSHDSLENGYVTLTAYRTEGATNVSISDHKQIVISTYSTALADEYATWLSNEGIERRTELVAITHEFYHWHYRLAPSRDRDSLIGYLYGLGFVDWQPGQ